MTTKPSTLEVMKSLMKDPDVKKKYDRISTKGDNEWYRFFHSQKHIDGTEIQHAELEEYYEFLLRAKKTRLEKEKKAFYTEQKKRRANNRKDRWNCTCDFQDPVLSEVEEHYRISLDGQKKQKQVMNRLKASMSFKRTHVSHHTEHHTRCDECQSLLQCSTPGCESVLRRHNETYKHPPNEWAPHPKDVEQVPETYAVPKIGGSGFNSRGGYS
jgi:hypothetical protein